MPRKSNVWKHFTRLQDDNGNPIHKAKCNNCSDGKEFGTKAGTTNMWRHFLQHFVRLVPDDQGNDKNLIQCTFCQAKFKSSASMSSMVEHVEACLKKNDAGVWSSQPPTVATRAPPYLHSKPIDPVPAYLVAQPQELPSAPSCPSGSSSDGKKPGMDEQSVHLARMIALHGYDPSIVDDDHFKSFVESINPEFRLPSRADIEAACDVIFEDAKKHIETYIRYSGGRISLAVGEAKIMEREIAYTLCQFIDAEWNLHKVIVDINLNVPSPYVFGKLDQHIQQFCDESNLVELVRHCLKNLPLVSHNVFMMVWGLSKDHSKLKDSLNCHLPCTFAVKRGLVCTTFVDLIFHSVAEHLNLQIDAQFREGMHAREVLFTRQERDKFLSDIGVDIWAYKEAWYSWYCSLLIICYNNHSDEPDLEFAKLLCKIWGKIYRAIKIVSAPKLPTSHLCLIELFNVKNFLEFEIARASGVCAAFIEKKDVTTVLKELIEILDKAIQESYLIWSVPLVLDPRYNLDYVKSIFSAAYVESIIVNIKMLLLAEVEEFDDEGQREAQAELDRYLIIPGVYSIEGFGILKWWKVQQSDNYPRLAVLAMDALAMPTCSQPSSEQIGHITSRLRGYSRGIMVSQHI